VQDQGGEISNMEVDRENKPFTKNLVQAKGMTLDEAAEAAEEAGLIGSRDINALLEKIDAEIRGGGTSAGWYAAATTGPGKLSRKRVEIAVQKIIADKGRDTGKDVARVKELLMLDKEFNRSPFAPKTQKDWDALIKAAMEEPATPVKKVKNQTPSAPREAPAGQQEIAVPPPTIGERPIIGREATPEEAPLFSKAAQEPDEEQTSLMDRQAPAAKSPTEIIADALRSAADQIAGPDVTKMARVEGEGGKVKAVAGMDPRIMKVLGGNLYSGNLGRIAVKEMIQNAVDSVRGMPKAKHGQITVSVDTVSRTITVEDTGVGMLPEVATKELVDIGGSKKTEGASGGFGIAKVAIFANAEQIDITTRAKRSDGRTIETHITGTGEEWMDATKGLDVATQETSQPTGTTMNITMLPSADLDRYSLKDWMKKFQALHRLPMQITMTLDGQEIEGRADLHSVGQPVEFTGGTATFYISSDTESTSMPTVQVLNNGLPQFDTGVWLPANLQMPRTIAVDIKSTGTPESENYPFSPDRERLRQEANSAVSQYIKNVLAKDAAAKERNTYIDAIKQAPLIENTPYKVFDTANLYDKSEVADLAKKPYLRDLALSIGNVFHDLKRKLQEGVPETTFGVVTPSFEGSFHGIGLGPDYLGVNITGKMIEPDMKNLILINPYVTLAEVHHEENAGLPMASKMEQADFASSIVATIIHELSHEQERGHGESFAGVLTRNQGKTIMEAAEAMKYLQDMLNKPPQGSQGQLSFLMGGGNGTVFEQLIDDYKKLKAAWVKGTDVFGKISTSHASDHPSDTRASDSGERGAGRAESAEALSDREQSEAPFLARSAPLRGNNGGRGIPPGGVTPPTGAGTIDPGSTRSLFRDAKKALRPFLLGSLTLDQLAQVYGKEQGEVRSYNTEVQDMKADFIGLTNKADPIIRRWDQLKPDVSARMAKVMEDARVTKYDPDQVKTDPPMTEAERRLVTEFKLLPDDAKALYREVRDFYKSLMNERFTSIIKRIERTDASDKQKRDAVDEVSAIQKQLQEKVYFPLMRFGQYVVISKKMVDGKETDREVSTFESVRESEAHATAMKARGWTVKQTTMKQYNPDADGAASKMTQRLLDVIDSLPGSDDYVGNINTKKDLKDAINQLTLQSLPEMSYAKQFIHAKDIKGASVDALRAFAHSALHGAHHISRIKHTDQLSRLLRKMDTRIDKADGDVTEARQIHNELVQRHETIINPNTDPFAAFLGQAGFVMSLGGVVATGVTNMTQTPLVTFPWLGARYGFLKSSAALTRAYNDFFTVSTLNRDSLFDASKNMKIPAEDRKMLTDLQRRGHIDLTQTMDISGRAAQDNLSSVAKQVGTKRERAMQLLGFTFHAPEVMNRQVSALAAFRLEREKGGSYEEAVAKAIEAVSGTHFIYTQENRARYMSGNVLRVLMMFKQYGQHIAFTYGKAAHAWLADRKATPEERKVAKRQILSMFALQLGAAGYLGMPFFGTVASMVTALLNGFGDDDEKIDWETELRKAVSDNLVAAFGEDVGKWSAEIAAHGLSRATPWDLAGRLGQSDLFYRPPKMEREGRAAAMDVATSLAGPVVGYGVNAWLGVEDLVKAAKEGDSGHLLRGVEELSPAVLRNAVKGLRYEIEGGVRTRDQYKQVDVNGLEILGQIFGFGPSKAAEMYEGVTAIKQKEHRITTYRQGLIDSFASAVRDEDEAAQEAALEKITAFNERTPILHISGDTLRRSLRGKAIHEEGMEGGVYLPRTRQPLRDEGRFANY
jgi:hypothetical protein